ncbi:MAG: hypothetical protein OZSIB_0804 [Candidatus Ozemobacter sibiricus]|jgi:hypothetical protein|uniref:Glycosyl hydrolase family 13 catalytic domain-containing protein n=1 Tax=Candidatus Ozemobacter sibiricus TaxID=2268124 RepID=A0A367ZUF7_9BACT|nr:MAG: hypothetical protein OZSIB_0804 [Candidatus Ozemobacter sibiricus]
MNTTPLPLFVSFLADQAPVPLTPLPPERQGRIYADVPHRYFATAEDLEAYVGTLRQLGVNVLLLLPHFLPSFSEYVVKDYERPCRLFGSWERFAAFMRFVAAQGLDRMIDIPFNHADWQAEHLRREWFIEAPTGGKEAGADDVDADGNRIRVNWGAFILDNANPALIDYWLERVIFPHVGQYHVNAIRIDAAWGLDPNGLARLVRETKARHPHVWFLAENLGMDKLINLARSGIAAGAERYFHNMYWYSGGRGIPADIYRFHKQSGGKPSCAIFASHDTLMPALKALATVQAPRLGHLSDKALHRQVIERDGLTSLAQLSAEERARVVRLMELEFILAAFQSTDLMFVAGAERGLLAKVDVLTSGPADFAKGIDSDLPGTMARVLQMKAADPLFCSEGVLLPFGEWRRGQTGCRGYVRTSGRRHLLVAVNTDPAKPAFFRLPKRLREARQIYELTPAGRRGPLPKTFGPELALGPGQAAILFTPEE